MSAGFLKLGKLLRLVPHPVIYGFVNGLAIVIFMSQLDRFKDASGNCLTGPNLYLSMAEDADCDNAHLCVPTGL